MQTVLHPRPRRWRREESHGNGNDPETWVLWALLSVVGIIASFGAEGGWAVFGASVLAGLYALYLYRGGRWVLVPVGCLMPTLGIVLGLSLLGFWLLGQSPG